MARTNPMACTVIFRGVPVARVTLTFDKQQGDSAAGDIEPLAAYALIEERVRTYTIAQFHGYIGPVADPASAERAEAVMADMAALENELEFLDEHGVALPVHDVMMTDATYGGIRKISVLLTLRDAGAPLPALRRTPDASGDDAQRPS
jgi:hypothetical protein